MTNKSKQILIAAIAAIGIVSPALAHPLWLPSEIRNNTMSAPPQKDNTLSRHSGFRAYAMITSGAHFGNGYSSDGGYVMSGYNGGIETQR